MNIPQFSDGFYILLAAAGYYIYNDRMFAYLDLLTGVQLPKWKSRVLTFIINFAVFFIISQLKFYLVVNWTIFAAFLVLEIRILYGTALPMSLFCGIQGALLGLAFNFITRSGTALLTNQSLLAFDARVYTIVPNLKAFPIAAGFFLAGMAFWWMQRKFRDWPELEENPMQPVNLRFSLCLVISLFVYLELNLLIYFIPGHEVIIKLWGMKSGLCVLVGYYIGTSHIYMLAKLLHFERESYSVRQELISHRMLEEKLEKIAFYDLLTGCCSREVARNIMEDWYSQGMLFHVCFADVNNLKQVNDQLGHDAGDRYLAAVAHALLDIAKEGDLVSRYGGDEFLLLTLKDGIDRLESGMKNACWALTELSDSSEYPFRLWVSYGIASSNECETAEELFHLLDQRMYANKRRDKEGIEQSEV